MPTVNSQAARVIAKFGGHYRLAKLLNIAPSTVYRWTWPAPRGTGGFIPSTALGQILAVAELAGVNLTVEDVSPL